MNKTTMIYESLDNSTLKELHLKLGFSKGTISGILTRLKRQGKVAVNLGVWAKVNSNITIGKLRNIIKDLDDNDIVGIVMDIGNTSIYGYTDAGSYIEQKGNKYYLMIAVKIE